MPEPKGATRHRRPLFGGQLEVVQKLTAGNTIRCSHSLGSNARQLACLEPVSAPSPSRLQDVTRHVLASTRLCTIRLPPACL